ncbi:nibrin-like [Limulus polyphemus]|uniref:Nibrin-like n=1 Tax=Limulus polyphemus TaxID=6850 RepID=A0ABM1BV65_LIMPO|nr:nibrin-like [Limulus polyphemus]
MWKLVSLKDEGTCYRLFVGKVHTVGRKGTDLLILNDLSISRKHAVLLVSHSEASLIEPHHLPILTLKDNSSKYGTYLNGRKLSPDVKGTIVNKGNEISFGQCGSSFKVDYEPLVVTTSAVDSSGKKELKPLILKLGGHVVAEWRSDCTHLVMNEIKVTVKTVCALVSLKPLVTPDYFRVFVESIENKTELPDASRFLPPVGESAINKDNVNFNVIVRRKTLFTDKTFVFLTAKQYKKLHLPVTLGGGKAILLEEKQDVNASFWNQPGLCVMEYSDNVEYSQSPDYVRTILSTIKKKNQRPIPESDIGLAVVYCSTEKFCNPDFDFGSALFGSAKLRSQSLSQQEVYAPETQTSDTNSQSERLNMRNHSFENKGPTETIETLEVVSSKDRCSRTLENQRDSEMSEINKYTAGDVRSPNKYSESQVSCVEVCENRKKRLREDSGEQSGPPQKHNKEEREDYIEGSEQPDVCVKRLSFLQIKKEQSSPPSVEKKRNSLTSSGIISNNNWSMPTKTTSVETSVLERDSSSVREDIKVHDKGVSMEKDQENLLSFTGEIPHGFLTTVTSNQVPHIKREDNYNNFDELLPCKVLQTEYLSLVHHVRSRPCWIPTDHPDDPKRPVKNFKKFKKVEHAGNRMLPRIIGGHDLQIYIRTSSGGIDDWLNENPESQVQERTDDGLFE